MNETILIINYFTREFPDNHPAIYQYIKGKYSGKLTSIEKLYRSAAQVFIPAFTEKFIIEVANKFLESKKAGYENGDVKIKAFYDNIKIIKAFS